MGSKQVINQWDMAAQTYSNAQREAPNNLTNWQMILDVLGDIKGKKILDAGCGDGYFTNQLSKLGAKVCGCDGSKNFINIAKNEFKNVCFQVCDLTQDLPFSENEFDYIVCSLTLMDIEDINLFFKESARILKKSGKLVFTIVHPCFFQGEWEKDKNGNKLCKKIFDYYNLNSEILHLWNETTHYHRPISWYSRILKENNFLIEQISENPEDLENFTPIKLHQKRIPLFICFCCVLR